MPDRGVQATHHKAVVETEKLPNVGNMTMNFTMELFDYGSRVEIDPPDDDDTVDMTDEAAEGLQTW